MFISCFQHFLYQFINVVSMFKFLSSSLRSSEESHVFYICFTRLRRLSSYFQTDICMLILRCHKPFLICRTKMGIWIIMLQTNNLCCYLAKVVLGEHIFSTAAGIIFSVIISVYRPLGQALFQMSHFKDIWIIFWLPLFQQLSESNFPIKDSIPVITKHRPCNS